MRTSPANLVCWTGPSIGGPIFKFVLLALLVAVPSGMADPRIGSWTLISAQATLTPPDQLSITDGQGGVHVVMSGETHLDFTTKSDGHDTPVPGNPGFDQVELRRINKRQSEVEEKKDGAVVATVGERLFCDKGW
jgi:hypothetical protein